MARPPGSKNKTPQELKTEALILQKKAEIKMLDKKRLDLAAKRKTMD